MKHEIEKKIPEKGSSRKIPKMVISRKRTTREEDLKEGNNEKDDSKKGNLKKENPRKIVSREK